MVWAPAERHLFHFYSEDRWGQGPFLCCSLLYPPPTTPGMWWWVLNWYFLINKWTEWMNEWTKELCTKALLQKNNTYLKKNGKMRKKSIWKKSSIRNITREVVFLLGNFHRQRRLAGYRRWGCNELDMTEWLSTKRGSHLQVGGRLGAPGRATTPGGLSTRTPSSPALSCIHPWLTRPH